VKVHIDVSRARPKLLCWEVIAALKLSKCAARPLCKEQIALGLEEADRLSEQVRSLVDFAGEDEHLREAHSPQAPPVLVVAALGVGERLAGERHGGLELSSSCEERRPYRLDPRLRDPVVPCSPLLAHLEKVLCLLLLPLFAK
jgi:hypothetical protein